MSVRQGEPVIGGGVEGGMDHYHGVQRWEPEATAIAGGGKQCFILFDEVS